MSVSKRTYSILLKLFLVVILFLSTLFPYGNAIATGSMDDPIELPHTIHDPSDVSFSTPLTTPQELTQFRTATSKRFVNPDGTLTEHIFQDSVHYRDPSSGKWLLIDSNLVQSADGNFRNKSNNFKISLPPVANGGFTHYTKDGTTLSFRSTFSNGAKGIVKGNEINYTDVTTDTDVSYAVVPNGLKETIILKSSKAPSTYSFEIKLKELTYKEKADGSVAFYKVGTKTPLFYLVKPFLIDANLNSIDAEYQFRKDTNGKTILDIVVDPSWLQDPSRVYPVLLDPTVTEKINVSDTFISDANPTTNYENWAHNYVGKGTTLGVTRTLIRFQLPELPSGSVIDSADLTVTNTDIYSSTQTPVVNLNRITSDWISSSVTYNSRPSIGATQETSITASNTTAPYNWNFSIKDLVNAWYNGSQANYGMQLMYADETLVSRELLASDDTTTPDSHPKLTVNYTIDGLGYESFWTFDGPVNMGNRNLVLSETDINFPGRHVSLSVDRTYNSRSESAGVFGYGWSSPFDIYLDTSVKGPARLIDGDGTVHYFTQDSQGNYISPPGLFWSMTKEKDSNGTFTHYKMTTSEKTDYIFNLDGYLTQIKDANGNTVTFTLDTANQVTSIKDAASHSISLTYLGGRVDTATDPAGRQWKYGYDTAGRLVKVTTPNLKSVQYRYDSNNNLIAYVSPEGNVIYYVYTNDDYVSAINPTNMITNSNFEVDANGDGLPDHFWYSSGEQDLAASLDNSANSPYGKAFKIETSSAKAKNWTVFVSDPMPADPSKTYTLSGYMKANQKSGTLTSILSLLAYDAAGTNLGELARMAPTGMFSWIRDSRTLTPGTTSALPAGTTSVRVKVGASVSSGEGESWWDAVQLEEAAKFTEFVSGNEYTAYVPTRQSARYDGNGHKNLYTLNNHLNVEKFQQDPSGSNLTHSYTWDEPSNLLLSYQDPKLNPAWNYDYYKDQNNENTDRLKTITDPKLKTQSFEWDTSKNLTKYIGYNGTDTMTYESKKNLTLRDPSNMVIANAEYDSNNNIRKKSQIGAARNLIDNSNFERGVNADGTPIHFQYDAGQKDWWALSSDKVFGNKSLTIAADSNNIYQYTILVSDSVAVDKTQEYVLSGYLKSTSGSQTTVLSVLAYDSTGTRLGEIGRTAPKGSFAWQHWSVPIHSKDFPTGTSTIRVKVAASNSSGYGNSYFDAIQLEQNALETGYNLLDNSGFEKDYNGDGWPDYWEKPTGTTGWDTVTTYEGKRAVSISDASTTTGIRYGDYFSYDPNKSYNLTAMVKTEGLSAEVAHVKIQQYDTNMNLTGSSTSKLLGGTSGWQLLSAELKANGAATGTVYIRPVLVTGNATGTVYFDSVRFQEGIINTQFDYDASNTWVNKVTTANPDASNSATNPLVTTTFNYDPNGSGNILEVIDPLGFITKFTYTDLDQIKTIAPPGSDLSVHYDYNNNGNLKVITNKDSAGATINQTTFDYNTIGQLKSITDPLMKTTKYSYSPAGRLEKVETPKSSTTSDMVSYGYDKVDRLTNVSFNGTKRYQYGYDKTGNIISMEDIGRQTWSATYNSLNQLDSWADGKGSLAYTLDDAGNVTEEKLTVGTLVKTKKVKYNQANQPTILTDNDQKVTKFLFNENGKLSALQSGNNVTEKHEYTTGGQVTKVQNRKTNSGGILSSYNYGYFADGNVKSVTDHTGQTRSYTYTAKGELESDTLPSGNTAIYQYDPLGNREQRQEKKTDGTIVKTTTYGYNVGNQLTSVDGVPWTYFDNGNLKSNGEFNFTWDASGRLTQVSRVSDGSTVAAYEYDGFGRRVKQTVNGVVTTFLYNGWSNQVVAEFDGTGNLIKYYTWSPTGELLSITDHQTTGTPTYYTVRNAHGDIVQLTDANGNVAASYTYDAWGNIVSQTGTVASLNPYRYAGYRYDEATGLYYLMARYYDPEVGRFISKDPVFQNNMYVYASNNPVMYVDPDGEWFWMAVNVGFAIYEGYSTYQEGGSWGDVALASGSELVGLGKLKKAGKLLGFAGKVSKKSVLKSAQLPTQGKIRFVPSDNWTPSQPLPKQNGGFVDKFGNMWTKGPSRTKGQPFEWDVQLSRTGKKQLGHLSRDGSHLNVSLDGKITHK